MLIINLVTYPVNYTKILKNVFYICIYYDFRGENIKGEVVYSASLHRGKKDKEAFE